MCYLTAMNWDLLFSKYIYYLNFVINIGLFISCNITNSYIVVYLVGNIVNIYCLITHSWLNIKSFDYKMKHLSRSSEHMYILSQTHYLSGYLISLQNSRSLLYLIYQVYKLGRNVSATLSLLSLGLERKVKCNNGYFINGYVFYTEEYE
jgi:hypothetical protein